MAEEYSSSSIRIIRSLEAVKKRPGMFVGDTDDGTGLHEMLWEVFSNSLDQFLAGKCTTISVIIHSDNWVEVIDDGEGIRVDEVDGRLFLEAFMTELHHTATFDGHAPHTHVGRVVGVGVAVVNALSSEVEINIYRDGYHWAQTYTKGKPSVLKRIQKTDKTGTSFKFLPDSSVFSNFDYDQIEIKRRLKELACLNPGLQIKFEDYRTIKSEISSSKGISELLDYDGEVYSQLVSGSGEAFGMKVDVAFIWHQYGHRLRSFANQLCTVDGGTHVKGLISGIANGVKTASRGKQGLEGFKPVVQENLSAVVHINIADPKYASPTKDKLANPTAKKAVKTVVTQISHANFVQNQGSFKRLIDCYISRQVHSLWIKSYKDCGQIPDILSVQNLLNELFEESSSFDYIVDSYRDVMTYLVDSDPEDISLYFLLR